MKVRANPLADRFWDLQKWIHRFKWGRFLGLEIHFNKPKGIGYGATFQESPGRVAIVSMGPGADALRAARRLAADADAGEPGPGGGRAAAERPG